MKQYVTLPFAASKRIQGAVGSMHSDRDERKLFEQGFEATGRDVYKPTLRVVAMFLNLARDLKVSLSKENWIPLPKTAGMNRNPFLNPRSSRSQLFVLNVGIKRECRTRLCDATWLTRT